MVPMGVAPHAILRAHLPIPAITATIEARWKLSTAIEASPISAVAVQNAILMAGEISMNIKALFRQETTRRKALVQGYVVSEPARCVQCGICSYNCPINIDVRQHAWQGIPVVDSHCLTCGECVARCPRGVLRFMSTSLFDLQRSGPTGD
jgi:ferredoxin